MWTVWYEPTVKRLCHSRPCRTRELARRQRTALEARHHWVHAPRRVCEGPPVKRYGQSGVQSAQEARKRFGKAVTG